LPDKDLNSDKTPSAEEILRKAAEDITDKAIIHKPLTTELLSLEETKKLLYELQVQKIELEMQNSELRHSQEELFSLKQRYFDLYNDAPVGYVTLDEEEKIIESNATLCDLLQVDPQTLLSQSFARFVFSQDQDIYYLFRKKFSVLNEAHSCSLRILKRDGTFFNVTLTSKKTQSAEGDIVTHLIINDVSEQVKTEEALKAKDRLMLVQSRLAIMGEMISMIAHQWRQPLSAISVVVSSLQIKQTMDRYDKEYFSEQLEGIEKCTQHMSTTIDDFRNFFKDDKQAVQTTLPKLVNDTLEIIRPIIQDNNIEVKTEFLNDEAISTYQNEMKQVLLNILNNSKEVLVQRKTEDPIITIKTFKEEERYCISVHDNAGGIADNIIDKIFEPYYTTKESYNGTGLGLYMSKIIIHEHCKGKIEVSNLNGGALFTISIHKTIA